MNNVYISGNSGKAGKDGHSDRGRKISPGPFYAWPMGIWFSLFFVVPLVIIVAYSFMKRDMFGGVVRKFSFDAYRAIFAIDGDTGRFIYLPVLLRTLMMTLVSTLVSILIALPCGYAIARSRHQTVLLILVIVPFLTNSLIRIFAWMTILGENGLMNKVCEVFANLWYFITGNREAVFKANKFMFTKGAVILVSIYMYLPYAILPIFTSVDRFDFTLLEAARDLGATKSGAVFRILLPGIKSGIISSVIFTFIPIFGNYTVPQLVGSTESYMLGNIIMDQITKARNLPLASAFSVILTVVSMAAILFMLSSDKKAAKLIAAAGSSPSSKDAQNAAPKDSQKSSDPSRPQIFAEPTEAR